MRKTLVYPATWQPLLVEDVKRRPELRIDADVTQDDTVLADLILSAEEAFQEYTGQVLRESTWDLYLDVFPEDEIVTPAPLKEVVSIGYFDSSGAFALVAEGDYAVDSSSRVLGRITPAADVAWPTTLAQANSVAVRIVAGYASPAAIPRRIRDGMYLKIKETYDGTDESAGWKACWADYRRIWV